jgi:hypothetical protein
MYPLNPSTNQRTSNKRPRMLPFDPCSRKCQNGTIRPLSTQPNDTLSFTIWLACNALEQWAPLTISSVHTRRIHTFNFPSTPSTSSNSTPSHQHLRAGFRQKSRSFCAMPTTLFPARSPLTSVRNLASARLQMTALFGSPARWPQRSS